MNRLTAVLAALLMAGCSSTGDKPAAAPATQTIMAVFAHPDDEIDVSPLLTQLAANGHKVYLAIATQGEIGIREHAKIPAGDSLAHVRRRETECTCKILGINPPIMLGMNDGKLTSWDALATLQTRLDSIFAIYKPDIIITWGSDGGSGHPDHRMVHSAVTALYQSGLSRFSGKLFYTAIPTEHWKEMPAYGSATQTDYHKTYNPVETKYLTTRIKCDKSENDKAIEAMLCYKSQYDSVELEDNKLWMRDMNRDTVFLRPYTVEKNISNSLFNQP